MRRHLRVLLVENSEDTALLLLEQLKRGDYDVVMERVETAIGMEEALTKTWDIVLVNDGLPQFNTLAALKLLRGTGQNLPFIIVSEQIEKNVNVPVLKEGASNGVMKTNLTRLLSVVEKELRSVSMQRTPKKNIEQNCQAVMENTLDIILTLDAQGVLNYVSPSCERILGYNSKEVLGKNALDFICPEDLPKVLLTLDRALAQPQVRQPAISVKVIHKNGVTCILEAVATNLLNDPTVEGLVVNCYDITQWKQAEERLQRYAFYDSLTGLPNRTLFLQRLGELYKELETEKTSSYISSSNSDRSPMFAVLFLDLDRFQKIKYSLGHLVADRLLIATAERLMEVLNCPCKNSKILNDECDRQQCLLNDRQAFWENYGRICKPLYEDGEPPFGQHLTLSNHRSPITNLIARVGIDEFAMLLTHIWEVNDAIEIADRVQNCLTKPFHLDGHEVFTNASIGIALSNSGYDRPEDLLRAADTALHFAKLQQRKPRLAVFDISMQYRAMAGLQLETDLRRTITVSGLCVNEQQEFFLNYQPIVSLMTGRAIGFEALVRWCHPQMGFISPEAFIPLTEETGLILPLGDWVLREACQQMTKWVEEFPKIEPFTISVNLSGLQLAQPNLIQQIDRILLDTGLPSSRLKLELTESILMKTAEVTTLLTELKDRQIKLSIDDFGTGYSSLSRLHQWPLDTLKIDRSFVSAMAKKEDSHALVRAIISLAHNLSMEVIAEGVETAAQAYQLWAMQCEAAQGYFFAKPLDSEAATAWLQEKINQNMGMGNKE